jgi:hypothetical protein
MGKVAEASMPLNRRRCGTNMTFLFCADLCAGLLLSMTSIGSLAFYEGGTITHTGMRAPRTCPATTTFILHDKISLL